jgi:hypothetical protein
MGANDREWPPGDPARAERRAAEDRQEQQGRRYGESREDPTAADLAPGAIRGSPIRIRADGVRTGRDVGRMWPSDDAHRIDLSVTNPDTRPGYGARRSVMS